MNGTETGFDLGVAWGESLRSNPGASSAALRPVPATPFNNLCSNHHFFGASAVSRLSK